MPARRRIIVLDRDGVINQDAEDYIKTPDEWIPLPGSLEAIGRLCAADYEVAVVTNQSGVGRGLFSSDTLERIHAKMAQSVAAFGGKLAGVYFCPHTPSDDCECRKPKPGLMRALQADLELDTLSGVPYVGDKHSDLELAAAVGARGILVRTGKGRGTASDVTDVEIFRDLAAVVDKLLGELLA